ncbi:uncharacterized protein LOC143889862 isoform X2 [Tasmannia lanceolata]
MDPDGHNPCMNNGCSIYCELDGEPLNSFHNGFIVLRNLTVNQGHYFLLNVSTSIGERNSSAYKWFIDTIPPTASIVSERSFTNAGNVTVDITFSEACTGQGGFKCINASSCDVLVNGPGSVDASTLRMVEPYIKYSLVINLSMSSLYGRVQVKMANNICADRAGNLFTRTNGSVVVVRFDRRPVYVDLWASIPSYELEISEVPRTVLATNKMEDLNIFLDFSDPVINSTKGILSVLHVNDGYLVPIRSGNHANRRFGFELKNVSGTQIISVKLESSSLIGRSGTAVSPVRPIVFLYDFTKPGVSISTSSPKVTKKSDINVVVEFTKPVFGFYASGIQVEGGRLARFKEISKALYSLTILAESENVVSVLVPEGKAKDIAGNQNLASNQLEVRHYSVPAISVALHSFVTAGLLATSLAAAVLALSTSNLAAIGDLTSGPTTLVISDPSRNFLGTVGHLQVFVFSDWLSVSLPIEYSETTKGLRWLVPREKLPWKKEDAYVWPHYPSPYEGPNKLSMKWEFISSYPGPCKSEIGGLHRRQNVSMRGIPYGLPLDSSEYFIYFLRGEPLSAANVIKRMDNYTGWEDFEMNMFWLGVAVGSLLAMHLLILVLLKWRTQRSVHGILSIPRFELFLLILTFPCICQSSAFVIRGGTTGGIISGALLLAVPAAFLLSVCLFLMVAIFKGSFVQYKEVKQGPASDPCRAKMLIFFAGRPTIGKWFHREGLSLSFLPRFGILFEDRKGPPVFVLIKRDDPSSIPEWIDSGQSGIGRMRAVNLDNSNEDTTATPSESLLGCARSAYIVIDLLRRACLGFISGAYSPIDPSRGQTQCILALSITLVQFLYLFILKPYIRRGVQVVETISLVCEAGIFGISFYIGHWNAFKNQRGIGIVMLALLLISFVCQLVNEWYALIKCLLQLPQSQKPSFRVGLKWVAKGLVLPFLPRKHWSRLVPGSSQPKTGLVPVVPLSPETELESNVAAPRVDPLSSMTATVVPLYSPGSPGLTEHQAMASTNVQSAVKTNLESSSQSGLASNPRSKMKMVEVKRPKGMKSDSKNELRKLQELAKASFSGNKKVEEGSSSNAPKERCHSSDESSSDDFVGSFPRN